jgi:hypothetical protein
VSVRVFVIASEAKQSTYPLVALWIASSLSLLAMTIPRVLPRDTTGKIPVLCFRNSAIRPALHAKIFFFSEAATQAHIYVHPALTTEGVSRSLRGVVRGAVDARGAAGECTARVR